MFHTYVASFLSGCCVCFAMVFSNVFMCVFSSVSVARFKCFRYFIGMLQVFHMDVANVAMVVHVCCKLLFLMFHLFFQMHVASVFI